MKLSENFTLEELISSATARIRKIDNSPDNQQLKNLKLLAVNILQPIRIKYGKPIIVTSGLRSNSLNKAVGGAPTSQHIKGEAADIICENNKELWDLICGMILRGELKVGQLIDENNLSWIHVSLPDQRHLNQIIHVK